MMLRRVGLGAFAVAAALILTPSSASAEQRGASTGRAYAPKGTWENHLASSAKVSGQRQAAMMTRWSALPLTNYLVKMKRGGDYPIGTLPPTARHLIGAAVGLGPRVVVAHPDGKVTSRRAKVSEVSRHMVGGSRFGYHLDAK